MDSLVPASLKPILRDRYLAAVADAEAKYRFGSGDEDALTGARGAELAMARPRLFDDGQRSYAWQVSY
ncbi:hypothetical protein JJE66_35405 [Bradyrhizobium diazoefficiens]|uniref:hypothetical protein n=1 Tax=Bradyrhizobium diazoefficiens TaxID=1355477 RepID=UPI00190DAE38|nr:hypothetical protein [Bradyrhizobium diazoefficiens]MBK3666487.1 hypothetical protein [Bradyrhizobium diazoefficiens]